MATQQVLFEHDRSRLANGGRDTGHKYYLDPKRGIVRRREPQPERRKAGAG